MGDNRGVNKVLPLSQMQREEGSSAANEAETVNSERDGDTGSQMVDEIIKAAEDLIEKAYDEVFGDTMKDKSSEKKKAQWSDRVDD